MWRVDIFKIHRDHPEVAQAAQHYDPALVIYYDRAINYWGLARAVDGGFVHQHTWANADGSYKPMSMELISWLHASDLWRESRTADEHHSKLRDAQEGAERKTQKDFSDDIDYIHRENRRQMQKAKDLAGSISGRFKGGRVVRPPAAIWTEGR